MCRQILVVLHSVVGWPLAQMQSHGWWWERAGLSDSLADHVLCIAPGLLCMLPARHRYRGGEGRLGRWRLLRLCMQENTLHIKDPIMHITGS